MYRKIVIPFFIFIILLTLPFICNPVFAEETLTDVLSKRYTEEKDICIVVKKAITEGINTKEVTKTFIGMGTNACLVVKCAIEAKGSLEQIIVGALEAGATSDVCSRCAIEAGTEVPELARILDPPLGAGLSPLEIGLPSGDSRFLSPSSFLRRIY